MGQRSQIYVRYPVKNGDKKLLANYYQWNFGERMISRARYGIEWVIERVEYLPWFFTFESNVISMSRIFDVNFDYKDVQISQNIIEEWKEIFPYNDFVAHVFYGQDNNDGKLFIDISIDGTIRYAFTDYDLDINKIMDGKSYMCWNSSYGNKWIENFSDEEVHQCEDNIKFISENAKLMTKEELEEFINYDYGYKKISF